MTQTLWVGVRRDTSPLATLVSPPCHALDVRQVAQSQTHPMPPMVGAFGVVMTMTVMTTTQNTVRIDWMDPGLLSAFFFSFSSCAMNNRGAWLIPLFMNVGIHPYTYSRATALVGFLVMVIIIMGFEKKLDEIRFWCGRRSQLRTRSALPRRREDYGGIRIRSYPTT